MARDPSSDDAFRREVCDWLTANGIDPGRTPMNPDATIAGHRAADRRAPAGNRRLAWAEVPDARAVRCWQCGAEPLETYEVSTLSDAEPQYIAGRWPPSDDRHTHAERPPTPAELEQAGHAALQRIRSEAIG